MAAAKTWGNYPAVGHIMSSVFEGGLLDFESACTVESRYFAACVRAQEGAISEIDETTVAYHIHEPLGVVGHRALEAVEADHDALVEHLALLGAVDALHGRVSRG